MRYDPLFPKSYGYQAWKLHAEDVKKAAIEDLVWRICQTTPSFVKKIAKSFFPECLVNNWEIMLQDRTYISLDPESCGAYTNVTHATRHYRRITGDINRDYHAIVDAEEHPYYSGYSICCLVMDREGFLPQNTAHNILSKISKKYSERDRFFYNKKACHTHVLMNDNAIEKFKDACKKSFPVQYGCKPYKIFFYNTENSSISFGIVYYKAPDGSFFKLPITAWEKNTNEYNDIVFDSLHSDAEYPIYNLTKIISQPETNIVLICQDEIDLDYIYKYHRWILNRVDLTTYTSIENTNFDILKKHRAIIFPKNSIEGCHDAFKLHNILEKLGITVCLWPRSHSNDDNRIDFDLSMLHHWQNKLPGLPAFVDHCQKEFGVTPPPGILPKAISLLQLPGSQTVAEPLLKDIVNFGDQLMLHACRGIGKSMLGLFMAICFSSGTQALNAHICPTRRYKVLIIDCEMRPADLQQRSLRIISGLGIAKEMLNELKFRSAISENKDFVLETEAGMEELTPDMEEAEIIILDSVFKAFPTAMASDFEGTAGLQKFITWCRQHGKTLVLIDHQGKTGGTAFGSMGKEISLDTVIRLSKQKELISAEITKNRNSSRSGLWLRYLVDGGTGNDSIFFREAGQSLQVTGAQNEHSPATGDKSDEVDITGDVSCKTPDETPMAKNSLADDIILYIKENPTQSQKEICNALVKQVDACRSRVQACIKALREANNLPFWENPPKK